MQKFEQAADKLDPSVQITKFGEEEVTYSLNPKTQWVEELLAKIVNDEDENSEESTNSSSLDVTLHIKRKTGSGFGEHLIVRGDIETSYQTPCVRCLEPSKQEVEASFAACFLHSHFEKSEELEETTHVFLDNDEMEVYFQDKGKANLQELVSEQIFMEIDPLPLHDADCKGLCQTCGENLNLNDCGHGAQ
jgi:uncharacterized protein